MHMRYPLVCPNSELAAAGKGDCTVFCVQCNLPMQGLLKMCVIAVPVGLVSFRRNNTSKLPSTCFHMPPHMPPHACTRTIAEAAYDKTGGACRDHRPHLSEATRILKLE